MKHDQAVRKAIGNNIPQSSPIFRLPLEIRRMIYAFVFRERIIDVHHHSGPRPLLWQGTDCSPLGFSSRIRRNTRKTAQELLAFGTKRSPFAIAATCQQFYEEAAKVWYSNVRFFFYSERCMQMFLEEIGDFNRETIQHAGCNARWGPQDKETREILDILSTFPRLRTLTFEDVANGIILDKDMGRELTKVEIFFKAWEEEAQNLLRVRELLESVILTTMQIKVKIDHPLARTTILESRELKLNRRTMDFITTTSKVGYDIARGDLTKNAVCIRGSFYSVQRIGLYSNPMKIPLIKDPPGRQYWMPSPGIL
jgi:hypothetical protein